MFGIDMIGNYDSRKIGRDDYDWGFISTCRVSDGDKPYETAVEHKSYNNGKMVIVESYDTKDEAKAGHAKWIATMTAETLPDSLTDCANSAISQLASMVAPMTFARQD